MTTNPKKAENPKIKIPFKVFRKKTTLNFTGVHWKGARVKRLAHGKRELALILEGDENRLALTIDPLDVLSKGGK